MLHTDAGSEFHSSNSPVSFCMLLTPFAQAQSLYASSRTTRSMHVACHDGVLCHMLMMNLSLDGSCSLMAPSTCNVNRISTDYTSKELHHIIKEAPHSLGFTGSLDC
ncbi:hypothetical protein BDR07DRAFT_69594 [Suillus spraguei]|nr:hypothetical protein BDR07DRAFT_69594 [Suillus spraguei]